MFGFNIKGALKAPFKTIIKGDIEYNFRKIKGAKHLKIRIKSPFLICVTLPFNCSFKTAENFVESKKDWIEKNLKTCISWRIEETFNTKSENLIITTGMVKTPKIFLKDGIVQFIYPLGADFYSKEVQNTLRLAVKKALYIEAKSFLPKRIEYLANKFGFKYQKIALKTAKTRWGSCSFGNNINLNINLMTLSLDEIDYVLIHELCHTVEKNHGTNFWALVEKCIPNAKEIRAQLKKERMIV